MRKSRLAAYPAGRRLALRPAKSGRPRSRLDAWSWGEGARLVACAHRAIARWPTGRNAKSPAAGRASASRRGPASPGTFCTGRLTQATAAVPCPRRKV